MESITKSTFHCHNTMPMEDQASYMCEYCKKQYTSKGNLVEHRKTHLLKSDFRCSLCGYATNFKHILIQHLRVHTKERPFKCPEPHCNSAFAESSTLYSHRRVHHRLDESLFKFKCAVCSFKAPTKVGIKSHLKVHSEVKKYKCDLCPYQSKYQSDLKRHQKRIHSTVKPFKCQQSKCDYSCKMRSALRRHMVVHSADKPLLCSFPQCVFRTKWKAALRRHEKFHAGDGRCKCSLCRYSFSQWSSLRLYTKVQDRHCGLNQGQRHSSTSINREGRIPEDAMATSHDQGQSQVTHVQWSVDWGRILGKSMGRDGKQISASPQPVIKVEADNFSYLLQLCFGTKSQMYLPK